MATPADKHRGAANGLHDVNETGLAPVSAACPIDLLYVQQAAACLYLLGRRFRQFVKTGASALSRLNLGRGRLYVLLFAALQLGCGLRPAEPPGERQKSDCWYERNPRVHLDFRLSSVRAHKRLQCRIDIVVVHAHGPDCAHIHCMLVCLRCSRSAHFASESSTYT